MYPDEITFVKCGTCTEFLVTLRKLEDTDLFEGLQEENVCLQNNPG